MLIREEYMQVLSELGLTYTQAKIYITLLCVGGATASDIYKHSNIARQDVYRILTELQEEGLVEKAIAKPAVFRPVPLKFAISILLQKKEHKISQLKKKAFQQLRNLEVDCIKTAPLDSDPQFKILSKNATNPASVIYKLGKAIDEAQKSVMCSTTSALFSKIKHIDENIWAKAVRRGVEFRFILGEGSNGKVELALDPVLKNTDYFKIRWVCSDPPTCVLLIDEREAFCRMGADVDCPVLWSAAPRFVALIKDYFETKWEIAKP